MTISSSLLEKYNKPAPRYTSYPTVPYWKEGMDRARWAATFRERFAVCNAGEGISLYIHLPFCESMCIYCGCNKKITTNHKVEEEYIQAILKEWGMYLEMMEHPPVIRELHLGGGTPTFFSPANLQRLLGSILETAVVHPDHSFSIEGHPNNTTREHLDMLFGLGFRRISYGVQDLNDEVQRIIHRIQPFERLAEATEHARAAGFTAINFDLIYGLPGQTPEHLRHTIERSLSLQPDRLAFYSYAHTPWLNCSQRLIDEKLLPTPGSKLYLYDLGRLLLTEGGYANIGMDHFALPSDELFQAGQANTLHRNFMGYTTSSSDLLLGLGVSAISDLGTAFAQNDKSLGNYYRAVSAGELPVVKGYFLTQEDRVFRRHILDIACKGYTRLEPSWQSAYEKYTMPRLEELEDDGMVLLQDELVSLTDSGHTFLRHCCKAFDLHLLREEAARGQENLLCEKGRFKFSNTI